MKLKIFMTAAFMSVTHFAFADYDSLSRQLNVQLEAQAAQKAEAHRQVEHNAIVGSFNRKLTNLATSYGRSRGLQSDLTTTMNDKIPGMIWKIDFVTKDGYECRAQSGALSFYAGKPAVDPVILSCIQPVTLKHIFIGR